MNKATLYPQFQTQCNTKSQFPPNHKTLKIKPQKITLTQITKQLNSNPIQQITHQIKTLSSKNQTKASKNPKLAFQRTLHHLHQFQKPHCFVKPQKLQTLNNSEITEFNKIEQKINKKIRKKKSFFFFRKKRGNCEIIQFQ